MTHPQDTPPANPAQGVSETRPWPLAGYAPGNYTCMCLVCEKQFDGDKRAYNCLECAAVKTKSAASATLSSLTPAIGAGGQAVARPLSWIDVLREWFGGERYARDYEYLDANYSEQGRRVAAYAATLAHPVQPGWRLVPEEPTSEMVRQLEQGEQDGYRAVWPDVLSAAPQPKGE